MKNESLNVYCGYCGDSVALGSVGHSCRVYSAEIEKEEVNRESQSLKSCGDREIWIMKKKYAYFLVAFLLFAVKCSYVNRV